MRPALLLALLLVPVACGRPDNSEPIPGEVDPATYVELDAPVREYFHHRKKAMLAGDPEVPWRRYPELRQGGPAGGINAEGSHVAAFRGVPLLDGDVHVELDPRIRISGDTTEVRVHGTESYLRQDFQQSAWELEMRLLLVRRDGAWTVVRTDETTDAERHQERRR
ncbi:MAG TPA: hypothetical protein VHG28_18060 [Longimicrobiaceae bacterium]|nr:hypothetical protein [Longimicrobiaceae bacterium]